MRELCIVIAFAAVLATTVWLLCRLSQSQTTAYLSDSAAQSLALAASGDTPYRWHFHNLQDIVAGRVFGAQSFFFRNDRLDIESSGSAFEIGLPLPRPLDTQRFPHLQISTTVDTFAELRLVVRERLDAPELVSAPIALTPRHSDYSLDLMKLTWAESSGPAAPPKRAAMLRLQISLAAHRSLYLHAAALERVDGAQSVDLASPHVVASGTIVLPGITGIYRLPVNPNEQPNIVANIAKSINIPSTPLILVPQHGRVEQQLRLRDAILSAMPAAIPIPASAVEATFAQARAKLAQAASSPVSESLSLRWIALGIIVVILIVVRLRPPANPRLRALVEIALVMAAPLWLIVGGHFDGNPDSWQLGLIGFVLLYAISLSFPRSWRWNGSARAWLLAAAVVALAAIIGWIGHDPNMPLRSIDSGHIARYLAWALLQQYLVCAICTERWRIVTGNAVVAVYLGALGFALMHTPNATLMLATLCGGVCWCALYLRERALLPLAVSHAASALLLLALLPPDILLSAEVGIRFLR
jgi:hypothetical protein